MPTYSELPYKEYSGSMGDKSVVIRPHGGEHTTSDPVEIYVLEAMGYRPGSQTQARHKELKAGMKAAELERRGLETEMTTTTTKEATK